MTLKHLSTPSTKPTENYNPAFFDLLFQIEEKHFWFRARERAISVIAKQIAARLKPSYRVLEIGCGTGHVLRALVKSFPRGTVFGMDPYAEGLLYGHQRSSALLVQGDIRALPFSGRFELIGLFDVLEHIPDDEQVLRDLYSLLAPGGALVLTVPAHPCLWSYFDEAAHHQRRYRFSELVEKLTKAGYRIEYITPFMASIFLPVWLSRKAMSFVRRFRGRRLEQAEKLASQEFKIVPLVNEFLAFCLLQETSCIARRIRLPFGTSLLAIARPLTPDQGRGLG